MIGFDIEEFKIDVFKKLDSGLPKGIFYHKTDHTKDVLQSAEYIAKSEGVSEHEFGLVRIAAILHDLGYINSLTSHEEASCKHAREILSNRGLPVEDIEKVCGMIMATKIPQSPNNLLEEIICDADLDYLGRDDYDFWADRLKQEFLAILPSFELSKWKQIQIDFLKQHKYFTKTSIRERAKGKEAQLLILMGT